MKNLIKILTIFFVVVLLFGIFSNSVFAGSSSATATRGSFDGEISFLFNNNVWGDAISLSSDTQFVVKQVGSEVRVGIGSSSSFTTYQSFPFDSNITYKYSLFDDVSGEYLGQDIPILSGGTSYTSISGSGFYIVEIVTSSNVSLYSISFNSNGGSAIPTLNNRNMIPTAIQSHPDFIPTKSGFTFDGWYMDSALTTIAIGGSALSFNITLYAKWTSVQSTPSTVDVTYVIYDNPLSSGSSPSQHTETFNYGDPISSVYDWSASSIDNYYVDGWYTDTTYTNRYSSSDTTPLTSDLTVYGHYINGGSSTPSTVNVTFILADIPSGAPYSSSSTYTYDYGDSATVIYDYTPGESGFDGWYYNSNYTNKVGGVGDTTTLTSDLTVYGRFVYVPPTYTISFESNGGSSVYALSGQTTIPSQLPVSTRYGYIFLGWYTDEELQDPVVPGATLSRNITLYAGWQFVPGTDIYVDPGNSLRGMFTGLTESLLTAWLTISSQVGFGGITLLSVTTTVLVVLLIYFVIKVIKG
ncbi:MAG: InlB B-repeat-containing protein [Clostridia bacterium]|nr:InlB B-repeat-containing protein [Clostridia bacterium]